MYQPLTSDVESQRKREEFRLAKFLIGLRSEYENVHALIHTNSEIPSLYELYSIVQRISMNSKCVALGDKSALTSSDRGASFSGRERRSFRSNSDTFQGKGRGCGTFKKCTGCELTSHTIDTCWDLY